MTDKCAVHVCQTQRDAPCACMLIYMAQDSVQDEWLRGSHDERQQRLAAASYSLTSSHRGT